MKFIALTTLYDGALVLRACTVNPVKSSPDKTDLIRMVNISLCCAVETDDTKSNGEAAVLGEILPLNGRSVSQNDSEAHWVNDGIDASNTTIKYRISVTRFYDFFYIFCKSKFLTFSGQILYIFDLNQRFALVTFCM